VLGLGHAPDGKPLLVLPGPCCGGCWGPDHIGSYGDMPVRSGPPAPPPALAWPSLRAVLKLLGAAPVLPRTPLG